MDFTDIYLSLRFIEAFLSRLFRIISMRLHLGEKSECEQQHLTARHQQDIIKLTRDCTKVRFCLTMFIAFKLGYNVNAVI